MILQEPAAWALLTEKKRLVLQLYSRPTLNGNRRNVRAICRGLGICHQAFYQMLQRAGIRLREVAVSVNPTPEPSALALGLGAVALVRRRKGAGLRIPDRRADG